MNRSRERLGVSCLSGLVIHRETVLRQWSEGVGEVIAGLPKDLVERTGMSFYTLRGALLALDIPEIDFIQIPTNLLDRRWEDASIFTLAQARGKHVFLRSVFLQG